MSEILPSDHKVPFEIGKPIVVVRLTDGVGNQLFQYAAGRALACRLDARLLLDRAWFTAHGDRRYALGDFSINAETIATESKEYRQWNWLKTIFGRKAAHFVHDIVPPQIDIDGHRLSVFAEKRPYAYDRHFERLSGSAYLKGFWQSARYFEPYPDVIRQDLRFRDERRLANEGWRERVRNALSVSVHIRRGDYLLSADRLTCSRRYYDEAISLMRARLQAPRFFVFSDDPGWCRENFTSSDMTIVDDPVMRDGLDDLNLMASCQHHVIANSSFSWWGAWLADVSDQIVVAPKHWIIGMPTGNDLKSKRWSNFFRL